VTEYRTTLSQWSKPLSRKQQSVGHGAVWFAVVSLTGILLTGRIGIETLPTGIVSGVLYAGMVYVRHPY
jgi:hypothetical protein